jgi:putative membrane protein
MRMLKVCSVVVTLVGISSIIGCSKDGSSSNAEPGASQGNEAPPAPATGTVPMTKLTDGQIAQIVAAVDSAEIEQAQLALSKTQTPDVRAFATHMVDQHTASKQTGEQLASQAGLTLAQSPKSEEMGVRGTQMLERLKAADASNFDKTYIDGQIEEHAEVLTMLDDQLIPAVTQPTLRDHLTNARGMVQQHLDQARKIQK